MGNNVNERSKDFLVSTADVAFFVNDKLAFTGTTSLNTSISVSMEDQEITGGKGNKTLYKYKYGRKLTPSIEMAEWSLAYIAANAGSAIFEGLNDVFAVAECVSVKDGKGTLKHEPVGKVYVETPDGFTMEIDADGSTITLDMTEGKVLATYQYETTTKRVTIDAESTPFVGRLIMSADKHNNKKGKVGEVQIEVPSFQLNGTFDISLEAGGTTTTKLEGDALAVDGASCSDGSVYAYITEIPSEASEIPVGAIAATPAVINLTKDETVDLKTLLTIVGIKGGMYSNIAINTSDCTFTSKNEAVATVSDGIVTGIADGTAEIVVEYHNIQDTIEVAVTTATV